MKADHVVLRHSLSNHLAGLIDKRNVDLKGLSIVVISLEPLDHA